MFIVKTLENNRSTTELELNPPVNLTPDRNIWEDFRKNRSPGKNWREAPEKIQPRWREAPDFLRYFGVCKGKSAKSGAKRPKI